MAGDGDGVASENTGSEEQFAFFEEEERLGAGLGFSRSLVIFFGLSFVFHFSYIFWRSASGRLHLDGSGATQS